MMHDQPGRSTAAATDARLQTLGRLELDPPLFGRPKPLLLLTYLSLEGPSSRDLLAELFFADAADPRDSLSTTLRRLRSIPGAIRSAGEQLQCRLMTDAGEILALLQNGEQELACRKYDGPFLAGVKAPMTVELEEWVFATREFLAGHVLAANLSLGEVQLGMGEPARALEYAQAGFSIAQATHPEPGALARLYHLMQRSGHVAADRTLALGNDVREQIMLYPPAGVSPSARLGIPPAGPLIGRAAELDAAISTITAPDTRLLTIHGPGGVGKTRLAQELLRSIPIELHFKSARTFVSLDDASTPESVAVAILRAMDAQPAANRAPWQALMDAIGSTAHLLVLDTWEHLVNDAGFIPELMTACPELRLIVTSRVRLNLAFEWVHTLPGLALPAADAADSAPMSDSLQLFIQQSRRHNVRFELSDHAAAARICRLVDGFPLGLALAAAWTRVSALKDIAAALEQDVIALDTPSGAEHKHSSLKRVLGASWRQLEVQERRALARLSICHGGFTREAAAAIAGADMKLLMRLLDRSWLSTTVAGRFTQHTVVRQYGRAMLERDPDEYSAALAAHREHYLAELMEAIPAAGAGATRELLDRLSREEANIFACLEYAVQQRDADTIIRLCEPIQWYFPMLGRFQHGREFFTRILGQLPANDPPLTEARSNVHSALSWFCRYTGQVGEALSHGEQAVQLAGQDSSVQTRIRAHDGLGQAQMQAGLNEQALTNLETGIALARAAAEHTRLVRILEHAIHVQAGLGQFTAARDKALEALTLVERGLAPRQIDAVAAYIANGMLDLALQSWSAAAESLHRAADLASEIGYAGPEALIGTCIAMARMGAALAAADAMEVRRAERAAQAVLAVAAERGEAIAQILGRGNLARAALFRGELDAAAQHLRDGLLLARDFGAWVPGGWLLPWLVELHIARGEAQAAARFATAIRSDTATPAWVREQVATHAGLESAVEVPPLEVQVNDFLADG